MKNFIATASFLFVLLLCTSICTGQSRSIDLMDYLGDSSLTILPAGNFTVPLITTADNKIEPLCDTVPVIMLVFDTLHYSNYTPQLNDLNYFDKAGALTWVTGYEVQEIENGINGYMWYKTDLNSGLYPISRVKYLDSDQKRLSKYIVVAQVIHLQ